MKFSKENIPFTKGMIKKHDLKAAAYLDAVQRKGEIDMTAAIHTATYIVAIMPEYDVASIGVALGHYFSDVDTIKNQAKTIAEGITKAERSEAVAKAAAAKEKEDIKEAKRIAKEAKEAKEKEARQKKQVNRQNSTQRTFVVSGCEDEVDDITTIIPVVNEWLAKNESVYLAGGLLSRWSDSRENLKIVNESNLGSLLGMGFSFQTTRVVKGNVEYSALAQCPSNIQKSILGTEYFHGIREVDGLISHPVVTPEGELIGKSRGYDENHKLLFSHDIKLPEVELDKAYRDLFDVFHEFPATAIPGALATVFTLLMRPLLPTAPMICMDAPTVSSGKSLLARCCIRLVCGTGVTAKAQDADNTEFDKGVKSYLQENPGKVLFLDDFEGMIQYNILKTILTEPHSFTFRILGTPKSCEAKTNFTIIITGNQIELSKDLMRRSIIVNLDTGEENPSHRATKRNPDALLKHIDDNRERLLSSAVTILQDALSNLTSTHKTRVMGTFETWSETVARSVIYIGQKLKDMKLLQQDVWLDVTPDMKLYNQMTDHTGGVLAEIFRDKQDNSWGLHDLSHKIIDLLNNLLGINKDNDNDVSRGIRLRKKKNIPREFGSDTYILRQLTHGKWKVESLDKNNQPIKAEQVF